MDIIYSHVKEPIRKGVTPGEVFRQFTAKLGRFETIDDAHEMANELNAMDDIERCHTEANRMRERQEYIHNLRWAISLAWDEVRPIALMNRRKKEKEDRAEIKSPLPNFGAGGGDGGL